MSNDELSSETPISANSYLAIIGIVGALFWFGTQAVVLSVTYEVTAAIGVTGGVLLAWIGYSLAHRLLSKRYLGAGVWLSGPFLLWGVVVVLAFVANGVGLVLGNTDTGQLLMWAPWALAFGIGYLGTGFLVERGTVYTLAGVASLVFIPVAVVTGVQGYHFAILGVLHGAPLVIDGYLGDRHLVDKTTPAIEARS